MTDSSPEQPRAPWLRRLGYIIAALVVFGTGWSQGELTAARRLGEALQHIAPHAVQAVGDDCPRELTREAGWSQSCLDLLPLTSFFPGEKK